MEEKAKRIKYTRLARATFNSSDVGHEFTNRDFVDSMFFEHESLKASKAKTREEVSKTIAPYLSNLLKRRMINTCGKHLRVFIYRKMKDDNGTKVDTNYIDESRRKTILERDFSAEEIGFAILKTMTVFKARISKRNDKINELNTELRELVEENTYLKQNLQTSKAKLIEFSNRKVQLKNGVRLNISRILKEAEDKHPASLPTV